MENRLNRDKWIRVGYVFFLFLLLAALLYCSNSGSLWVDEIFSLEMVELPWKKMIERAAGDVHPPLYYIMLKIFLEVTRGFGVEDAFAGKLFSSIPFFLTILLTGKRVAEKRGTAAALLSAVCLAVMPNMLNYAIEIRGYSWAMFFVTAAYLYAGEVLWNSREKDWRFLLAFGALAAYTHYFACVSVAIIYLGMLIWHKNDIKFFKRWLVNVLASCLLYLPWLTILIRQMGKVMDGYWIGPITLHSLYEYFRFLFEPPADTLHIDIIFGIALAAVYGVLFFCTLCGKRKNRESGWLLWGSLIPILTGVVGIAVSLLFRPVFVARYMIPALGCFWMAYAGLILADRDERKRFVSAAAAALILAVGLVDTAQFVRWETIRKGYYEDFQGVIYAIGKEAHVSADGEHIQWCLKYYLKREEIEYMEADRVRAVVDNTEGNREFWYFCSTENMDDMWLPENRKTEQIGEYHLEYYNFYVFRFI